jgi:hypothetical protein
MLYEYDISMGHLCINVDEHSECMLGSCIYLPIC